LGFKRLAKLGEPEELLQKLFEAAVAGKVQEAKELAKETLKAGLPANLVTEKLSEAMLEVDRLYERKEYFLVDVASAASATREAFKILEPHLDVERARVKGKVVLGSLKGNIQGLGKDIVAATLKSAGFEVVDLGVDVEPRRFVEAAMQERAQVIAVSITIDETVLFLKEIIDNLKQRGLIGRIKTVIGGRATSEQTCKEYGIDACAKDAWDCAKKVRNLLAR
jgi:methylmalonyl-CoA mutase cobalamin-binding domain/chain